MTTEDAFLAAVKAAHRMCVFCAAAPEDKTKEHVIPQWLIAMTGDPKRVVNFGFDHSKGKVASYAWQSFTMPACDQCNARFSKLESETKSAMSELLALKALSAAQYVTLLDWFDKVRVGLWYAYLRFRNEVLPVVPSFGIADRVGRKDRLLAVYPTADESPGITLFGIDSLLFHHHPSCFGLRINNLVFLNASDDYLVSGRLGFPHPRTMFLDLDAGDPAALMLDDFECRQRVMTPVVRAQLHKPSVMVHQPILRAVESSPEFTGYLGVPAQGDPFLSARTRCSRETPPFFGAEGSLHLERNGAVAALSDEDLVTLDRITLAQGATTYDLMAQVYELQMFLSARFKFRSQNAKRLRFHQRLQRQLWLEGAQMAKQARLEGEAVRRQLLSEERGVARS